MYTKGKWREYCLGSEGYQIRRGYEGERPLTIVKEEFRNHFTPIIEAMGGDFETQKANARLICALVNAAQAINPEHPEKVAENLEAVNTALRAGLKHLLNDHPYDCDKLKSKLAGVISAIEG